MKKRKTNRKLKSRKILPAQFWMMLLAILAIAVALIMRGCYAYPKYEKQTINSENFSPRYHVVYVNKDTLMRIVRKIYDADVVIEETSSGLHITISNNKLTHKFYNTNKKVLNVHGAEDFSISVSQPLEDTLKAYFAFAPSKGDTIKYCAVPTDVLYSLVRLAY